MADPDPLTAPEPTTLAWRVLGTLDPPRVRCASCGTGYVADDDAPECPPARAAGRRGTWEARQPRRSGRGFGAIEACPTRSPGRPGASVLRRDCPGPRPASRGRGTESGSPRSTRRRRSALSRATCSPRSRERRPGPCRAWARRSTAASTRPAHPASRRPNGGGSGPPTGRAGPPGRREAPRPV